MLTKSTLRPGLLVSLRTTIKGNVKYFTNVIEGDHTTEDGERRARWDTTRTIRDPDEHERAVKVRSLVRSKIQGACVATEHALLCPKELENDLDEAVEEARRLAREFNSTATQTEVRVNIVVGEIGSDDARAIRALNSEISDLMASMAEGLKTLNVEQVRKAANQARTVGAMLTPAAQERVQAAVDAARKTAREIVKAGEGAEVEIDAAAIRRVMEARTSFLDVEDDAAELAEVQPTARPVDVDLSEPTEMQSAPMQARLFDL